MDNKTKVVICGDRNWTNRKRIEDFFNDYSPEIDLVIEGGANGADMIAHDVAKQYRIPVKTFPANWTKYGKMAGPIRNREMLDEKPDYVVAFHNNIFDSKGTKDIVNVAKYRGILVYVYTDTDCLVYPGVK